jgi:hypothetical protein
MPYPYTEELNITYDSIQGLPYNFDREQQAVVRLVHDYRMYWKPPQHVTTLLLAESHKFTTEQEITEYEHEFGELPDNPFPYPRKYVRFVYCLSYGASHRLNTPPIINNRGTSQYWKLFNESVHGRYRVTRNANREDKILQKIALLRQMQNQGVWLLDASIMGLCNVIGGSDEYDSIMQRSLNNYCLPIIHDVHPERIIVIGKMVYDRLLPLINNEFINQFHLDWIHQPNAIRTNGSRRTLGDIL